jgi:hypothetical protein
MAEQRWTTAQVVALAPDRRAVKAARDLASLRTWSEVGSSGSLVWGRCQGSAREPYQITVDVDEPAFRCTCPSRKHPCKHAVALLLIWAEHGDTITEVPTGPAAAGTWAEERRARSARHAARRGAAAPPDPLAQARRQAEREATMTAGLDELDRWLGDLVRQGLAGARRQPYAFWDTMAARLVDHQLPGLAERVRGVGGGVVARDDWADVLLTECGRWHLAVEAWRRRHSLDEAELGDLRAFVGWPRRADEAAGFPRSRDRWVVAGVRQGDDGRIASQRTWLWGEQQDRWAVVLDFAAGGAVLRVAQPVGTVVGDEVALHPGSDPARATFSDEPVLVGDGAAPRGGSVDDAIDRIATWLAADPWRNRLPVVVVDAVLAEEDERWWLQDGAGARLPVHPATEPWLLLALTGGRPATVTAEWEDGTVRPLAVAVGGSEVLAL